MPFNTMEETRSESSITALSSANGRMRTYSHGQEGAYKLTLTLLSISGIQRAIESLLANSRNDQARVSITVTSNLSETHDYYASMVAVGETVDEWVIYAENYGGSTHYNVSLKNEDYDEHMNVRLRNEFIRNTLYSRLRGRSHMELWSFIDRHYGNVMSPTDLAALAFHVSNEEYRARFSEDFATARAVNPSNWTEDFSAFQSAWAQTKERNETQPAMNAMALAGLNTYLDERGRSFGIEIEVDFPNDPYPYTARERLAQAMYDEGLSRTNVVHGWHFAAREGVRDRNTGQVSTGYTDARNGWGVEFDRSVDDVDGARGCEIVSPIMYDSEQTWQDVAKVCELVESLGGSITSRHGLHVNIGARDFALDVPTHYRLVRLMRQFDDVLIRMAHNPVIGNWHRGRAYCGMHSFLEMSESGSLRVLKDYHSHMSNINLDHMPSEGQRASNSTRVEFRIFDGAITAGRIQLNVIIAMSLISAAIRGVTLDLDEERAGTHRTLRQGRRLSGDDWKSDTERFRIFVDKLLPTEQARNSALSAYAASRWQRQ